MNDNVYEIITVIAQRGKKGVGLEEIQQRPDDPGPWDSLLPVEPVPAPDERCDLFFKQGEISKSNTSAKVVNAVAAKLAARET